MKEKRVIMWITREECSNRNSQVTLKIRSEKEKFRSCMTLKKVDFFQARKFYRIISFSILGLELSTSHIVGSCSTT
jgi:hypothetical protein